jgi:hypothetical protein
MGASSLYTVSQSKSGEYDAAARWGSLAGHLPFVYVWRMTDGYRGWVMTRATVVSTVAK